MKQKNKLALHMTTAIHAYFKTKLKLRTALFVLMTLTAINARTVNAVTIGPDAYGYTATDQTTYSFLNISATGTSVLAGSDDGTAAINIGFAFHFYQGIYTGVFVNPNGYITFVSGSGDYSNVNLTTNSPNVDVPSIAVLWDDWVTTSGAVLYQTVGSPGTRQFIVQWNNLNGYSTSPSTVTFQAVFYEADNSIKFQYLDVISGDGRDNGQQATVGIRDTSGHLNNRRLQWSFNQAVISNGSAIHFRVFVPPTDISLSNSSIAENQAVSTTVGSFTAVDFDAGDTHVFSLVSGTGSTDNASFSIGNSTNLLTAASFNYETKSSYSIRVRATDQGGLTFEEAFTITVTNVNESPTNIIVSASSVAENQPSGTVVGTFTGQDTDAGNTHTFMLVSGTGSTDNASFSIGNSTNLLTAASFNYETKSSYSIRVRATDQGGLTFEKAFTITVTDVNEAPTNIALDNSSVAENEPIGTSVGTLSTTDPDTGSTHTFTLVEGTGDSDNASFTINGDGVKTAAVFDYETKSSYNIRVRATDAGGLFFEKQFSVEVVNVGEAPLILTQPQNQTVALGGSAELSVAVTGDAPAYQWRKNGVDISEAIGSSFPITNFQTNDAARYDVVVSNAVGSVTSDSAWLFVLGGETIIPTVAITSPKSNQRITNDFAVTMTGTAKDAGLGVAQVFYKFNESPFQSAAGTTNWSAPLTLVPGTNKVEVKAVDFGTNESKIVKRIFFAVVPSLFTLATNGFGTIISTASALGTPTNGAMLEVGRPYKITAVPGANNLFSNWTGSGTSPLAQFTFVMQPDMVLHANFVTNKFIAAAGFYNGLFHEETNVTHQSAGYVNVNVKSNLTYSAKLVFDGDTVTGSGKFDISGTVNRTLSRATKGKSNLTLSLDLGFETATNIMTGTVMDGTNWIAELKADRAVFNNANPATAYTNNYTMLLPGFADAADGPPGYGYGSIKVLPNGLVKLSSASSADAQTLSQSVPISKNGEWPFYVPLYKIVHGYTNPLTLVVKTNKAYRIGSMLGWLTFTNNAPTGTVSWIKTFGTNAVYPNGFTNDSVVLGSRYLVPATGTRALDIIDGTVTLTNGNLTSAITRDVFVRTNNGTLLITPTNQEVKLSLTASKGLLSGTFKHPDNTNATTAIKGIVLQEQKLGGGFFIGTNQGGLMLLE